MLRSGPICKKTTVQRLDRRISARAHVTRLPTDRVMHVGPHFPGVFFLAQMDVGMASFTGSHVGATLG